jgi:hypothetical protein
MIDFLWSILVYGVVFIIGGGALLLYLVNLFKAVTAVRKQEFSAQVGIRVVGIFFPIVGVIMGVV